MKNDLLREGFVVETSICNPKIEEFYKKINNYVNENYIYCGEDEEYFVKYNGNFYETGYFYGPDLFYYVKRVEEEPKHYIDYKYVEFNVITMEQMKVKNAIERINSAITLLENEGYSKRLLRKSIKI